MSRMLSDGGAGAQAADFADLRAALLGAGVPETGLANVPLDDARLRLELDQTRLGAGGLSSEAARDLCVYLVSLAAQTCPLTTLCDGGMLWLASHRSGGEFEHDRSWALRLLRRSVPQRTAYALIAKHKKLGPAWAAPWAAVMEQRSLRKMVAAGWRPQAARRWLTQHPGKSPPATQT